MTEYTDIEAVCAACKTRYPAGQWASDEPLTDETAAAVRDAGEAVEAQPLVGDVETEGAIGCAICGADQMMLEAVEDDR